MSGGGVSVLGYRITLKLGLYLTLDNVGAISPALPYLRCVSVSGRPNLKPGNLNSMARKSINYKANQHLVLHQGQATDVTELRNDAAA